MARTLDSDSVLHQSPDLPYGGEYAGRERYKEVGHAMNLIFDQVGAESAEFSTEIC